MANVHPEAGYGKDITFANHKGALFTLAFQTLGMFGFMHMIACLTPPAPHHQVSSTRISEPPLSTRSMACGLPAEIFPPMRT